MRELLVYTQTSIFFRSAACSTSLTNMLRQSKGGSSTLAGGDQWVRDEAKLAQKSCQVISGESGKVGPARDI